MVVRKRKQERAGPTQMVRAARCGSSEIRARELVLVAVDAAAFAVQLMVHLVALFVGKVAAVGFAIRTIFLVDVALLAFEPGGLAGVQLARLDSLRETVLLILAAVGSFVVTVFLQRRCAYRYRSAC